MDWTVLIIWYLIAGALLGLIPAFIASNKGRSFGAWYVYGFCLFIVAFFHALLISSEEAAENSKEESKRTVLHTTTQDNSSVTVDLSSPIEILKYTLAKDIDGDVFVTFELRAVGLKKICAVKLEAKGFNSFNDIITVDGKETFYIIIQDVLITNQEIYEADDIKLPSNEIRKLQLTVLQTVTDTGEVIQNTPNPGN